MEQQIIECFGKKVVVIKMDRNGVVKPNFQNTGMALQGFLRKGETIEEFNTRKKKRFDKWLSINEKYLKGVE